MYATQAHESYSHSGGDIFKVANGLSGMAVVEALGLPRKRRAERRKFACPGCGSSDALHAYPVGVVCYSCKGTDGGVRSAVDAACAAWGLPPLEAARALLRACGADGPEAEPRPARYETRAPCRPEPPRMDRRRLVNALASTLAGPLGHSADVWEYLRGRGFEPWDDDGPGIYGEDVHGIDGPRWGDLCSALEAAGAKPHDVRGAGLRSRHWEHFCWLAVIYRRPDGAPDTVRFRATTAPPSWWTGPAPRWRSMREGAPAWPFRSERAAGAHTIVVCEGETDTLAVELAVRSRAGITALGGPGAGAWRSEWGTLLHGPARVIVVADKDEAGTRYARSVHASSPGNVRAVRVAYDGVKDCADLWRAGLLEAALSQALGATGGSHE